MSAVSSNARPRARRLRAIELRVTAATSGVNGGGTEAVRYAHRSARILT
jgi:hypothetical protein